MSGLAKLATNDPSESRPTDDYGQACVPPIGTTFTNDLTLIARSKLFVPECMEGRGTH